MVTRRSHELKARKNDFFRQMNGGAAPRPSLRETRNILNRKSCKATLAESKNKDMELKMRTTGPL